MVSAFCFYRGVLALPRQKQKQKKHYLLIQCADDVGTLARRRQAEQAGGRAGGVLAIWQGQGRPQARPQAPKPKVVKSTAQRHQSQTPFSTYCA